MGNFWGGLAESIDPYAKALVEERLKRSRPSSKLQQQIFEAIQASTSVPNQDQVQRIGQDAELQAALGMFGQRPNLNQEMARQIQATPEQVQASTRSGQFLEGLRNLGLTGAGSDGISFSRYGAGGASVSPVVFDSTLGQYVDAVTGQPIAGPIQKGTPIRNKMVPGEVMAERARQVASAQKQVRGMTPDAAQAVSSIDSANLAIEGLVDLERQHPGVIRQGALPGMLVTDPEHIQRADLLLRRLNMEVVTARGGKQLTRSEINFISQVMPNVWRNGRVNMEALTQIKAVLDGAKRRIQGSVPVGDETLVDQGLGWGGEDFVAQMKSKGFKFRGVRNP